MLRQTAFYGGKRVNLIIIKKRVFSTLQNKYYIPTCLITAQMVC